MKFFNKDNYFLFIIDFLKHDDFIRTLLWAIESDQAYLYTNLRELENVNPISRALETKNNCNGLSLLDILIHLILAFNKKFSHPDDNIILKILYADSDSTLNRKVLSETILKLFNLEGIFYKKLIVTLILQYVVHGKLIIPRIYIYSGLSRKKNLSL